MNAALLPVKAFNCSKKRLEGFLAPGDRTLLARAMFEDVCATLGEAQGMGQGLECLLAVSAEPYVVSRCRDLRIPCLEEREQLSHSDSVIRATSWAMSLGITSLLSLPIDTPAVTATEILALLDLGRRFQVVIVPSADGSGTNALLRTPPDAISPHFGPDSCRLHVQEAEVKGMSYVVVPSPALSNDIDTPEDLQNFVSWEEHCRASRTWTLARQLLGTAREHKSYAFSQVSAGN